MIVKAKTTLLLLAAAHFSFSDSQAQIMVPRNDDQDIALVSDANEGSSSSSTSDAIFKSGNYGRLSGSRPTLTGFSPSPTSSPIRKKRPSKARRIYIHAMTCADENGNCQCPMGECNMDECEYSCSCDGGRCKMRNCQSDCSCDGGDCIAFRAAVNSSVEWVLSYSAVTVCFAFILMQ